MSVDLTPSERALNDQIEWDGDQIEFDYESRFGTFHVLGTIIEQANDMVRFEAEEETGPGIDEAPTSWTGRIEADGDRLYVWVEARFVGNNDRMKGTVA